MRRICFLICLYASFCVGFTSLGHASPTPADSVHFCLPLDIDEMQARDSIYAANKQALNLNVGSPRTVRMIYFLPNDRPYRASVVDSMKSTIRRIQTFYGEQMQAHGYGYKTFAFESDASGEPIVHRVDGQHADSHYLDNTSSKVPDEVHEAFDRDANIYLIVVDNSNNAIGTSRGRRAGGTGGARGKVGGHALVHGAFSFRTVAHEFGHAFGLQHDFNDDSFIMSYGWGRHRLSACHAEFLSVHPYYVPSIPIEGNSVAGFYGPIDENSHPIGLLSSSEYSVGSRSVPIQIKASDTDGIHQMLLFVRTAEPHPAAEFFEVKACRSLNGESSAVVEFDYNGIIPSDRGTNLSNPVRHEIFIQLVDSDGNHRGAFFYLIEISPHLIATLRQTRRITSVAFSPDGNLLATGSNGGKANLWDVATQQKTATFGIGRSVAFSPDGASVAVGGADIALWDVSTKARIATLSIGNLVNSIAFSPDGFTLASGSWGQDRTIKLWNLVTRETIATLDGNGVTSTVAFSPDGTTLASGGWGEAAIRLWDISTRRHIATLSDTKLRFGDIRSVAFSPDGTTIASGSGSGYIYELLNLWDVQTRNHVATLANRGSIHSVAFSPDGSIVVSGTNEGAIKLWDVAKRALVATLPGHPREVTSVAFSPGGRTLASGGEDNTVRLWDVSKWTSRRPQPQTLQIISGNNQQSSPGSALANPFIVEVRDQNGNPLQGVRVTFTVTAGDGKLSGRFGVENAVTDASGRAQRTLTLGPNPGANAVKASVVGIVEDYETTFNATGIGTPTTPTIDGGDYSTWHLPNGTIARLGKGSIGGTVAFSPDGRTLAVSGGIGVWLYEVATQNELSLFTGHQGTVRSVAFSPDGTMLVSGSSSSYSGTLKLWNVSTGRDIATFGGNRTWRQAIGSVAFSPDGNSIAAGSYGEVNLWDVASKTKIATLAGHTRWVHSVAYSPDGKMLAAGLNDDKVELWDISARTKTTLTHEGLVGSVAFSPDGRTLASAGTGIVKLWDVATRTVVNTLKNTFGPVAYSPDGTMLFAGDKLWDANAATSLATFGGRASFVAFSPDGRTLATGTNVYVSLWDIQTHNNVTIKHSTGVRSIAFSPDGTTLASGGSGSVQLWDVVNKTDVATLDGSAPVAFFRNGTTLVTRNKLWNLSTKLNVAMFPGSFHSVAISPDGTILASGGVGSTVKLWDVATRQNIGTLEGHTGDFNSGAVQAVAFSPNGLTLASGSRDNTIKLWNVAERRNTATLRGHNETVESVAFSPDGETLASGSRDRTVRLWNVTSEQGIATLRHRTEVLTVAFGPDGNSLVSGSADGSVLLWDPVSKENTTSLNGHTGWVRSVAFSSNGTTLASGATDGTVLLWDMSSLRLGIPPSSGSNSDAVLSLDLIPDGGAGNQVNDGVTSGTVSGKDTKIAIEVFASGVKTSLAGLLVKFDFDSSVLAFVKAESGAFGFNIPQATGTYFAATENVNIPASGFLARGEFKSLVDVTDRPFSIGIDVVTLAESQTVSNDIRTTKVISFNSTPSPATFSISLDANSAAGDQGVTTLDVGSGSVVPIQLFGNDIRGVNGISARFEFDVAQVGYDGFDPGSLLPNAQVLAVPATNPTAIDISVVSFGGQAAVDSGMVGTIRFRTTDAFSGTTLRMVSAEIGRGDQREKLTLSDTGVMLRLAQLTPDFNGDGKVDFGDFVAFGMHFGASRGDARYEAKYDLDEDGAIGFGDFLIFGREFGT